MRTTTRPLLTFRTGFDNIDAMNQEGKRIEDFVSGTYGTGYEYRYFIPSPVNLDWAWESKRITMALDSAGAALAALDASSRFVPDMNLFIQMHVFREASSSSRIEGTHTEIQEAVLPEEAIAAERRDDWREVNNYVLAMTDSIRQLETLPLSMRLLRGAHETLLRGVRGKDKMPGEIRRSQNWVGGYSIRTARYVPPSAECLPGLLADLEKFWHNDEIMVPDLIRCAISHYQFETIHPFLDGNGRIGRLLIPFYLISKGRLRYPSLYISSYLESHREEYYEGLSRARSENALGEWILFFLRAVEQTSLRGYETFQRIFSLRDEIGRYCMGRGAKGARLQAVFNHLYSRPCTTVNEIAGATGLDYQAVNSAVKLLLRDGHLLLSNDRRRNRIFTFGRYLEIFKDASDGGGIR